MAKILKTAFAVQNVPRMTIKAFSTTAQRDATSDFRVSRAVMEVSYLKLEYIFNLSLWCSQLICKRFVRFKLKEVIEVGKK